MTYTIEAHKRLQFLRERIKSVQDEWADKLPRAVSGHVCSGSKYLFRANSEVQELGAAFEKECNEEIGGRDMHSAIFEYLDNLADSMKAIRRARKPSGSYAPLKKQRLKTDNEASGLLTAAFPRSHTSLNVGEHVGVHCEDAQTKYNIRNYVTVGVSWWKSIGSRGLALINAPSGVMFTLRCKPRNVKYVAEDDMQAWEVTAVAIKHGRASEVTGWLVTHLPEEHSDKYPLVHPADRVTQIPHAFGKNLSKAHSLMKQRTVRHLVKQLGA